MVYHFSFGRYVSQTGLVHRLDFFFICMSISLVKGLFLTQTGLSNWTKTILKIGWLSKLKPFDKLSKSLIYVIKVENKSFTGNDGCLEIKSE